MAFSSIPSMHLSLSMHDPLNSLLLPNNLLWLHIIKNTLLLNMNRNFQCKPADKLQDREDLVIFLIHSI